MGDYISGAPDGGQQAPSLADRLKAMINEYGVAPDGGQQTSSPADRLKAIINGYGTQAAIGVRKGASSILGLPVDLASLPVNGGIWALNKTTGAEVPYVTDPVGGSKQFDELLAAPPLRRTHIAAHNQGVCMFTVTPEMLTIMAEDKKDVPTDLLNRAKKRVHDRIGPDDKDQELLQYLANYHAVQASRGAGN